MKGFEKLEQSGTMLNAAHIVSMPSVVDARGVLTAIEGARDIPFEIKRIFYMHHIKSDRGGHAHRDTDQVVIAVSGSFTLELFDGKNYKSFDMNDPTKGVYVPRMIFIRMFNFTHDSVCLVIANSYYDITRSFRSQEAYLDFLNQ
jgi:dTDP-4-dehydrorhamnose 3,5-epimerase-like enzyme